MWKNYHVILTDRREREKLNKELIDNFQKQLKRVDGKHMKPTN